MKKAKARKQLQTEAPEPPKPVLTRVDLAQLLGVSTKTIERHADELPKPFLVGRTLRWSRVAVEAWMSAKQN